MGSLCRDFEGVFGLKREDGAEQIGRLRSALLF